MDIPTIERHGDALFQAWRERRVMRPLREQSPDITIEDAYAIQSRYVARRVEAGETIVLQVDMKLKCDPTQSTATVGETRMR